MLYTAEKNHHAQEEKVYDAVIGKGHEQHYAASVRDAPAGGHMFLLVGQFSWIQFMNFR